MFTFEQLYDFNNLFLNKSYLKKRMKIAEDKVSKLEEQMIEVHDWREKYIAETQDKFD